MAPLAELILFGKENSEIQKGFSYSMKEILFAVV
jgi:hypothetical protein